MTSNTTAQEGVVDAVARRLAEHPVLGPFLRNDLRADDHDVWELAYQLVTGSIQEHMDGRATPVSDTTPLRTALAAGRLYVMGLPASTCGEPIHIPSFEALAAIGIIEDALAATPPAPEGLREALIADDVKLNPFGEPLCADCDHGHTEGAWSDRDPNDGTCWNAGTLVCGCPKFITPSVARVRASLATRLRKATDAGEGRG